MKTKTANPWLLHVAKFRKSNPKMLVVDVMKKAKLTYKPKGGK